MFTQTHDAILLVLIGALLIWQTFGIVGGFLLLKHSPGTKITVGFFPLILATVLAITAILV